MPIRTSLAVLPAGDGPVQVEEAELPEPGPHQAVVTLISSGVCHSNLPRMYGERKQPSLLGHEGVGTVTAVGEQVTAARVGDRVIITWVPRFGADGTRRRDDVVVSLSDGRSIRQPGIFTWAEQTVVDEQFLVPLPENLDAVPAGVVGCAVITGAGAMRRSVDLRAGQSVAIFGAGGVGLCAIAAARILGAEPLIAVDVRDDKLALARSFGATVTINATTSDPVESIREVTRDPVELDAFGSPVSGVDFAVDCIGHQDTMEQIFKAARSQTLGKTSGGTAVLVGVPTTRLELDPMDFHMNQKKYIGSLAGDCRPDRDIPLYLDWYADGSLDLSALVTRRYSLADAEQSLRDLAAGDILGRAVLVMDQR